MSDTRILVMVPWCDYAPATPESPQSRFPEEQRTCGWRLNGIHDALLQWNAATSAHMYHYGHTCTIIGHFEELT